MNTFVATILLQILPPRKPFSKNFLLTYAKFVLVLPHFFVYFPKSPVFACPNP